MSRLEIVVFSWRKNTNGFADGKRHKKAEKFV